MWFQQREPRGLGQAGPRGGLGVTAVREAQMSPVGSPAARGLCAAVGWRGGSRVGKGCGAAARPQQVQGSAEAREPQSLKY